MAKRKQVKKSTSKKAVKKSPVKKSPSASKSRKMSSAEIRLKNQQAEINKVIKDNKKVIDDINKKYGTDLEKFIKPKGSKTKKKVKTIVNEALNNITKARKIQSELTIERQIVSNGAYKPKTTNKPVFIPEKTPAKKGIRTIGTYHPWNRTEYIKQIFKGEQFGVDVDSVNDIDVLTDIDALLDETDKGFTGIDSGDVLILKIDTTTGKVFTEKSTGVYGSKEKED